MSELRRRIRRYVDLLPSVGTNFREARHAWTALTNRPRRTPFGFTMVGNPTMVSGEFEPLETAALVDMLASTDVFVDVGANIGFYTCLAASRGVHVIAVEPLRNNLDLLFKNLYENHLSDGVEVYPVGLSDAFGLLRLYGWATGASLLPGWAGANGFYRTIPVSQLDVLISDRFEGKRVVIKVDVEGAELNVLRGATATLTMSPRPRWLVEICLTEHFPSGINKHFLETFDVFYSRGYRARTVEHEGRPISREDVTGWFADRRLGFGTHNFIFE